ncbi:hypothetical protein LXA43DRAFT_1064573 [Ganoderma leucocontextum]|nr:hypothetical protein LXA43DRAFT_1064573 [Ganoderma leucocontextum]
MASLCPCLCSICLLTTYEDDDGNQVPGSLQTSKTRKQHELNDAKREKRSAMQIAWVEAQVMFTTMETWTQHSGVLTVQAPAVTFGAPSSVPAMARNFHHTTSAASPGPSNAPGVSSNVPSEKFAPGDVRTRAVACNSHPTRLCRLQSMMQIISGLDLCALGSKNILLAKVDYQLERLIRFENTCWDCAKITAQVPGFYVLPHQDLILVPPPSTAPALEVRRDMQLFLLAALIMVIVLHSIAGVAHPYTTFVLATIRAMILGAIYVGHGLHRGLMPTLLALLKKIPDDV